MNYLLDTGFWIALYNPRKEPEKCQEAETIAELIETENIMYEFLNSKFSRKNNVLHFEKLISRPNYIKVFDEDYRNKAIENFFNSKRTSNVDISLVDEIIKEMIEDTNLKIDFLISFDVGLKNYAISRGVKTN